MIYCARLTKLSITSKPDLGDYKKQETTVKNHSLKSLFMKGYLLSPELFSFISERFPSLQTLKLTYNFNCMISNKGRSYLPVHMSHTSLKTLEINFTVNTYVNECTARFNRVYLKLITDDKEAKPRYCSLKSVHYNCGSHLSEEVATETDYDASIHDAKCLTIFIYCASIEKLFVKYQDDSCIEKEVEVKPTIDTAAMNVS